MSSAMLWRNKSTMKLALNTDSELDERAGEEPGIGYYLVL